MMLRSPREYSEHSLLTTTDVLHFCACSVDDGLFTVHSEEKWRLYFLITGYTLSVFLEVHVASLLHCAANVFYIPIRRNT